MLWHRTTAAMVLGLVVAAVPASADPKGETLRIESWSFGSSAHNGQGKLKSRPEARTKAPAGRDGTSNTLMLGEKFLGTNRQGFVRKHYGKSENGGATKSTQGSSSRRHIDLYRNVWVDSQLGSPKAAAASRRSR